MDRPSSRPTQQRGATALRDEPRRRGGLWLLLGVLGLLVIAGIAFLLVRNAADDGDEPGIDVSDDAREGGSGRDVGGDIGDDADGEGAGATTSPAPTTGDPGGDGPPTSAAPPAGGDLVTSSGTSLVPPPSGGLGGAVAEEVSGSATVESVVADEGFWVGAGPGERVYVVLLPEARGSDGESAFQVEAGQTIELTGTLVAAPSDPATVGLDAAEGSDELTSIGAYVEAASVALSE